MNKRVYMNKRILAVLVLSKDEALTLYPDLKDYYLMMDKAKKEVAKYKRLEDRTRFLSIVAKGYFEPKSS
jgi:hypothetical protein